MTKEKKNLCERSRYNTVQERKNQTRQRDEIDIIYLLIYHLPTCLSVYLSNYLGIYCLAAAEDEQTEKKGICCLRHDVCPDRGDDLFMTDRLSTVRAASTQEPVGQDDDHDDAVDGGDVVHCWRET